LFANQEQEIARFAIKAEGDKATVKTLEFTVVDNHANATKTELAELLNGNLRLVDVETDEEINATFEEMNTANGKIAVKSMNYEIAKDATANIKVMANISSISDSPDVMG
jgi:hypothetical protein